MLTTAVDVMFLLIIIIIIIIIFFLLLLFVCENDTRTRFYRRRVPRCFFRVLILFPEDKNKGGKRKTG